MKIFLDTANLAEIREAATLGVVDGITTNPSLLAKEKGDPNEILVEICNTIDGPISGEVVATDAAGDAATRAGSSRSSTRTSWSRSPASPRG